MRRPPPRRTIDGVHPIDPIAAEQPATTNPTRRWEPSPADVILYYVNSVLQEEPPCQALSSAFPSVERRGGRPTRPVA